MSRRILLYFALSIISAAALASSVQATRLGAARELVRAPAIVLPVQSKPVAKQWVQVTRSMLACGALNDSAELRSQVLATLPLWKARKPLPEGCRVLKIGEKFLLDDEQTAADRKIVTKMWAPVCVRGCVPSMTPVYAPARAAVGIYLHRARPEATLAATASFINRILWTHREAAPAKAPVQLRELEA